MCIVFRIWYAMGDVETMGSMAWEPGHSINRSFSSSAFRCFVSSHIMILRSSRFLRTVLRTMRLPLQLWCSRWLPFLFSSREASAFFHLWWSNLLWDSSLQGRTRPWRIIGFRAHLFMQSCSLSQYTHSLTNHERYAAHCPAPIFSSMCTRDALPSRSRTIGTSSKALNGLNGITLSNPSNITLSNCQVEERLILQNSSAFDTYCAPQWSASAISPGRNRRLGRNLRKRGWLVLMLPNLLRHIHQCEVEHTAP